MFRGARRRDDERAATQAQQLVMAHWHRLPREARRVALTIEGADWRHHLERLLDTPHRLDAAVAFLTDELEHASRIGDATIPSPRVIGALLSSGDRHAMELAGREALPVLLAAVATPPAMRPESLADDPGTAAGADATRALGNAAAAARSVLDATDSPGPRLALAILALLDRAASDRGMAMLAPVADVLGDAAHGAFPALRRALRRDRSPMTRRLAWRLLGDHPLAIAALERLRADATDAGHNAVLREAHLLENAARERALDTARRAPSARSASRAALAPLLPPRDARLAPDAQRGLARLLAHADDRTADATHDRLLAASDERARLTAARHATGSRLTDYCLDAHPAVAEAAALRRSTLGVGRPADRPADHRVRSTRTLTRSPHAAVRRVAAQDLGLDELLSETGAPSPRAWTLARTDPDTLADRLGTLVDERDARSGVLALRALARLGLAGTLRERLADLVTGEHNPRLAATAAAVLGTLPGRAALAPLESALGHRDARVRANAVESLEQVSRATDINPLDRLSEIKASPEHRSRANALRALERLRLADEGAIHDDASRMLFDARALHRLAAVWLAERLLCDPRSAHTPRDAAWQAVARGVAALARTEDDEHIHARALRCARRLRGEIRRPAADPALAHATRRVRSAAAPAAQGVPA